MRLTNRRVGHDGRVVLERVADVAVLVRVGDVLAKRVGRACRSVVDLVFIFGDISGFAGRAGSGVVVPLISVVLPRNVLGEKFVANAARGGRWDREDGVGGVGVSECILTLTEVTGIVVIQQVVVTYFAVRVYRMRQRLQVLHNRRNAGLGGIRAIAVRTAARRG